MWNSFPDTKDRPKGKNDSRIKRLITAGMVIMLMFPTGVMADPIVNDIVADSDGNKIATITVGDSTTVNYQIIPSNTDPSGDANGCNSPGNSPATITLGIPAGVTASSSSITFTGCGNNMPVTFSSNNPGTYSIVINSVTGGKSGSLWNTAGATFTLVVEDEIVTLTDTTPPVIAPEIEGTMGNNGWYIDDVTVSWYVSDDESEYETSGCGPTIIDTDIDGATVTCSATSAGGSSEQSVTIKRDATPPTISGSASPTPNIAGWNNGDVIVSFDCDDDMSGIASCTSPVTLGEGAGQSVTGSTEDNAGNSASAVVSNINIDKTKPEVSVTGVTDGDEYVLGSVPDVGCSTTDALSGVATSASLTITGGPVGSITATCDGAKDNADNNGDSAMVVYNVIYDWSGFFQPIDNDGVLNVAKAGSAIPVKFSLNGDQGLDIFSGAVISPGSKNVACTNDASDNVEETSTAGQSGLSYDTIKDRYNYVWKTDKAWSNTCRQLVVTLKDGTVHTANFKFTK